MQTQVRNLLLAILALLILGGGCRKSKAGDGPIHQILICAGTTGNGLTCQEESAGAALEAWLPRALYKRFSTFSIQVAGPDRQSYRPFFAACIPPAWGQNVNRAKSAFIEAVRQGVRQGGAVLPGGCGPPGPLTPGVYQIQVFGADPPISPKVLQAMASPAAAGSPLHLAVVCDRSGSTLKKACTQDGLIAAFDRFVAESRATAGSSFRVYLPGSSRETARPVYELLVPELSAGTRAAFLIGARRELDRMAEKSGSGSALAEAIDVVAEESRERIGRYRLVLETDLFQYTAGIWDFSQSVPAAQEFIAQLEGRDLLADLQGTPVTVCGSHNRHGDATLLRQIRETWQGALQAMGAAEVKIFSNCEAALAPR